MSVLALRFFINNEQQIILVFGTSNGQILYYQLVDYKLKCVHTLNHPSSILSMVKLKIDYQGFLIFIGASNGDVLVHKIRFEN